MSLAVVVRCCVVVVGVKHGRVWVVKVHVCVAVRARAIVAAFGRCGSGVSVVQNVRLKMCAMCGSIRNINRKLLYTSLR